MTAQAAKKERTPSGWLSRRTLPRFVVPDLEATKAAAAERTVASLEAIEDPDQRLDAAVAKLDAVQAQLKVARDKRDRLVHSLYYFDGARGATFEGASGLSHVHMNRIKRKALGKLPRPERTGGQTADREAAREVAIANGLRHDPNAVTKLPKAAELVADLEGQEAAAMNLRDAYVMQALDAGVSRAAIGERINRLPAQVTRMALRVKEARAEQS